MILSFTNVLTVAMTCVELRKRIMHWVIDTAAKINFVAVPLIQQIPGSLVYERLKKTSTLFSGHSRFASVICAVLGLESLQKQWNLTPKPHGRLFGWSDIYLVITSRVQLEQSGVQIVLLSVTNPISSSANTTAGGRRCLKIGGCLVPYAERSEGVLPWWFPIGPKTLWPLMASRIAAG
jgi:hypothetical protein